ncbi:MAG: DUF115 domain-containing protein [Treponema sp.]|nr:DUF115 domain-containing protein [Treponema sp.]
MSEEKAAALHSRYNPQGEADRYINALSLSEETRFFILIEPGLGYMIAPLRKKFPGAKIIALHVNAPAPPDGWQGSQSLQAALQPPDSRWDPGAGIPAQDFLEREIPDSPAAQIRILEWRPALAVYGSAYRALVEESAAFIKRSDANARTTSAFGKRWFRNFFRNLEIIRTVVRPAPFSLPVLVTGAGPGLEEALPLVHERRPCFFVLAVSSSVAALRAAGIAPDMVVGTDGGQWAAFHLSDCFRRSGPPDGQPPFPGPLAAALTAALPSQCEAVPVLPISDGSLWQTLILKELDIPFVALPQRGTVCATALDAAFALTSGDIFIAGIDLENSGIRSHARPYALDWFLEGNSGRVNPVYSQAFKRAALLKAGGTYSIYASWFEKQLAAYPKRLYSIGKNNRVFSPVKTASFQTMPDKEAASLPAAFKRITLRRTGSPSRKARGVLERALRDPAHAPALRKELAPILAGGSAEPSLEELAGGLLGGSAEHQPRREYKSF